MKSHFMHSTAGHRLLELREVPVPESGLSPKAR